MAQGGHIFSRLSSPEPKFAGIFSDIYDKLAATGTNSVNNTQSIQVIQNILNTTPSGGGGGGSSIPSTLTVPRVDVLPPTADDGEVVLFQNVLWRWDGTFLVWQDISTILIEDTRANLTLYPASSYSPGVFYYETDYKVLRVVSPSNRWIPISSPTVIDTHANRIASYKSVDYPTGTPFYESNRQVTYISEDVVGTVNTTTASFAVAWVSGPKFDTAWVGYPIAINSVTYYFATVASGTAATLTTDPGNQTGAVSSVPSGRWVYDCGEMIGTLGQLPGAAGLGVNDTNFRFGCTDEGQHSFRFDGVNWGFAPGDPGSGWFCSSDTSPQPTACWELVTTGGTGTFTLPSGITTTKTFPTFDNGTDGPALLLSGSAYNGTPTAATNPTWVGGVQKTETESADVEVQAGTGIFVSAINHYHNVDNTVTQINPINATNGGMPSTITVPNWMRK